MISSARSALRPALVLILVLGVTTSVIYPAVVTGLAQLLFPAQANGSLITVDGVVRGSALIGQPVTGDGYFHSRPSAAGTGYDPRASGGSNKGPTSRALADTLIRGAIAEARAREGVHGALPADLVTRSASGLDPHISPASAQVQVPRVAATRGMPVAAVQTLVERHTEDRQFGVLGEPRVNVLRLNLALDSATSARKEQGR